MTTPVRLVLDALAHAGTDEMMWGYRLSEQTGLGSGTVYPILERLEAAGHVSARWETPRPADRPPRRFYELTGTGKQLAASVRAPRMQRAWTPRTATQGPAAI
jgi:PadR family transcriptional regulator PadR